MRPGSGSHRFARATCAVASAIALVGVLAIASKSGSGSTIRTEDGPVLPGDHTSSHSSFDLQAATESRSDAVTETPAGSTAAGRAPDEPPPATGASPMPAAEGRAPTSSTADPQEGSDAPPPAGLPPSPPATSVASPPPPPPGPPLGTYFVQNISDLPIVLTFNGDAHLVAPHDIVGPFTIPPHPNDGIAGDSFSLVAPGQCGFQDFRPAGFLDPDGRYAIEIVGYSPPCIGFPMQIEQFVTWPARTRYGG